MEGNWKLVSLLAIGLVMLAVAGCGNGESTSSAVEGKEERLFPWLKGPTREFLIRDGDNAVQTYGREATKAEREQASRVIAPWMRTRTATNWVKECSYFSRKFVKSLVWEDATIVSDGKVKTCPQALAYFGFRASGNYKNTLAGPIDSFRVKDGLGWAQYHGRDGHDWVIPMHREDNRWLVANATPLGRSR